MAIGKVFKNLKNVSLAATLGYTGGIVSEKLTDVLPDIFPDSVDNPFSFFEKVEAIAFIVLFVVISVALLPAIIGIVKNV